LTLLNGHGLLPFQSVGDAEHRLPAMAAPASEEFAKLSAHYHFSVNLWPLNRGISRRLIVARRLVTGRITLAKPTF
ncbi:MAG: hypothetical protein ACREDJ_01790, partial [Methylocella sp.]